ncbi:MucR family transcriptional regulator [Methylorubrum extorquens]|uniref:MucR family transcriptional regulator n=1 Tax=Methylorubrum extorquens TaxID=408 RepID=UPI000158F323|nr:transcriptional regulator protein-like protein [Methylorubrum extorquens PA1]
MISFEDGKAYKTLPRHLTKQGLTPEAYRAKWGLPVDYPMIAPAYSAQRSRPALDLGLGRQRMLVTERAVGGLAEPMEVGEPQLAQAASSGIPTTTEVPRRAEQQTRSTKASRVSRSRMMAPLPNP